MITKISAYIDNYVQNSKSCEYVTLPDTLGATSELIIGNPEHSLLLTVMIPTYNRTTQLKKTIYSALNQKKSNVTYGITVINNSECKQHKNIVRAIIKEINSDSISYYENSKNIGMFANWNMCIQLCLTKYCTILNDDDLLHPDFMQYFESHHVSDTLYVPKVSIHKAGIGFSYLEYIKLGLLSFRQIFKNKSASYISMPIYAQICSNSVHGSLGVVFNTVKARAIGGYSLEAYPSSDILFSYRYAMNYGITYLYRSLATYTWDNNASLDPNVQNGFLEIEHTMQQAVLKKIAENDIKLWQLGNKISFFHLRLKEAKFTKYVSSEKNSKMILNIYVLLSRLVSVFRIPNLLWLIYCVILSYSHKKHFKK